MIAMSQAANIRKIIKQMLADTHKLQEKININNKETSGIRYNVLKKELLNKTKYSFTEGAVTGALYTLEDRVDSIHKIKTDNGVFYYYSKEDLSEIEKNSVDITNSKEYKELTSQFEYIEEIISEILRNASQKKYKNTDETDLKYLRQVLSSAGDLNDLLRKYKLEKSFDQIESNLYKNDMPF